VNKTQIEWVRNPDGTQGYTWNPITGCLNGCEYCYARKLANGRCKPLYNKNWRNIAPGCQVTDPFSPRVWPKRLAELHQVKVWTQGRTTQIARFEQSAKGIFVCDMGELFGPWLPSDWTQSVMDTMAGCPQHRFYLLTKQPQELSRWSPFPANCWVGVSAWDHASFVNACHHLQFVDAAVKFISLEPLLEWKVGIYAGDFAKGAGVSWVIIGAQTKPAVIPSREWVEDIIEKCHICHVSVFLKESLRYPYTQHGPQEPFYWRDPFDSKLWRLLQEFPDGKVMVKGRAVPRENIAAEVKV